MADIFSAKKRSEVMRKVRSVGNRTTELRMVRLLRENGITGWRRHGKLPGRPDFVFRESKVAVFVDGCFWHGCPRCYHLPQANRAFWQTRVETNQARDRRVTRELRSKGWSVLRIWECRLRKHPAIIARVQRALQLAASVKRGT